MSFLELYWHLDCSCESELDSVPNQVVQNLFVSLEIRKYLAWEIRRQRYLKFKTLLFNLKLHYFSDLFHSITDIIFFFEERELIVLHATDVKAIFDHAL